jgi:class 3 adenylate cyclase
MAISWVTASTRLEGIAKPGTICLSEDAYRQVDGTLIEAWASHKSFRREAHDFLL